MDLRILLTTFGIIFLAEMGDKTQLAAMTMAADSKKPWAVFYRRESGAGGGVGARSFGR
jgi:putative Ca2+/H+ antiporter (TMEM165/GDT1 family)